MHGLAHPVVATERKRHIRETSRDMHAWQVFADAPGRGDERATVIIMLLDARGNGENIRVENDILGRNSDLFR